MQLYSVWARARVKARVRVRVGPPSAHARTSPVRMVRTSYRPDVLSLYNTSVTYYVIVSVN